MSAAAAAEATGEARADATAAATGGDDGELLSPPPPPPPPSRMIQMPPEYVDWVLSQKRDAHYPDPEENPITRTNNPIKLPGLSAEWIEKDRERILTAAALFKQFDEFQDQVRTEVAEKGVYEVSEDYFVRKAEYEAWLDKKWAEYDFSRISFADEEDED
uniref:Uncharacterized protein n=1 Tax=Leersia perrieri TaxID=77586 RepID=A0A0D9WDV1_9ORYZ